MDSKAGSAVSLARKASHELWQFAIIAGYLYVCLGALILFKTAILRGEGISYAPFGVAAVKALVLGKFILLGHAAGLGDRFKKRKPINVIASKSLVFMAMLLILSVVEECVVGMIDGRTIAETLGSFLGGTGLQIIATSLIMLLILVPYFAFGEFTEALGPERVREIMLAPRAGRRAGGGHPTGQDENASRERPNAT